MLDGNNTTKSWELKPYMCICMFLFFFYRSCIQSVTNIIHHPLFKIWALRKPFLQWNYLLFVTSASWTTLFMNMHVWKSNKCSFNTTNYRKFEAERKRSLNRSANQLWLAVLETPDQDKHCRCSSRSKPTRWTWNNYRNVKVQYQTGSDQRKHCILSLYTSRSLECWI